jgi:hypothetical protein
MGKSTTGMPDKMTVHNNNIIAFNTEVKKTLQKLEARGKSGMDLDLTLQLFSAYLGCTTALLHVHRGPRKRLQRRYD